MLPVLGPTVITVLHLGLVRGILSDINADNPGRPCSVDGRSGVCMYSMVCTFAKGTHLGTCRYVIRDILPVNIRIFRDRFIFGSCCRLPQPQVEANIAEEDVWEDQVNNLPLSEVNRIVIVLLHTYNGTLQVCGRRHEESVEQKARIQGGEIANRTSWPWQVGLRLKYGSSLTGHHCGAVLLNHHWVATAAHCVYK